MTRLRKYVLQQRDIDCVRLSVDIGATTRHRRVHQAAQRQPVMGGNPKQRRPIGDVEGAELLGVEMIRCGVDPPGTPLNRAANWLACGATLRTASLTVSNVI